MNLLEFPLHFHEAAFPILRRLFLFGLSPSQNSRTSRLASHWLMVGKRTKALPSLPPSASVAPSFPCGRQMPYSEGQGPAAAAANRRRQFPGDGPPPGQAAMAQQHCRIQLRPAGHKSILGRIGPVGNFRCRFVRAVSFRVPLLCRKCTTRACLGSARQPQWASPLGNRRPAVCFGPR